MEYFLRLRLNRPQKKNALTDAMQRQIADALDRADRDPEVAVAVIEGEGRDFCAGNDLGLIADMASGTLSVDDLAVDDFLGALSGFDNPLVAGVQGRAIGVGATLLLHCDVVVAAHDSRLSFPFVDISLVPEAGSGFLLPARIGYARAYALLCLAEPVSRREAAAMGLITRSVEAADLAAGLRDVAARLAAKPGQALRATKALMKDKAAIAAALAADRAIFLEQIKALGS
jgi:enoyl-CoA hydratase/carnithine racemase